MKLDLSYYRGLDIKSVEESLGNTISGTDGEAVNYTLAEMEGILSNVELSMFDTDNVITTGLVLDNVDNEEVYTSLVGELITGDDIHIKCRFVVQINTLTGDTIKVIPL